MVAATKAAAMVGDPASWERLGWDLIELILSRLPLRSIVVAGAVCRGWRAVVTHPAFPARLRTRRPWLFLAGHNNVVLRLNRTFAFDPDDGRWISLPSAGAADDCLAAASAGLAFAAPSTGRFSFGPIIGGPWFNAPPLSFPRCSPLVIAAGDSLVVVGGARFVGGLVDIEDPLAVELYDSSAGAWELCPPLPPEFRSAYSSSQWLSAALLGGQLLYIFSIHSCHITVFDVASRTWAPGGARTLRPPGLLSGFLVACGGGRRLALAGLCCSAAGALAFAVWTVDPRTMEAAKVGEMPGELLGGLFDADDEDDKVASLKCVGHDGMVYAFNEARHKAYPACACEIVHGEDDAALKCVWREVPPLPAALSGFHKTVALCSPVLIDAILPPATGAGGGPYY